MTLKLEQQLRYGFVVTSGATPASGKVEYWGGDILWVTPADFTARASYLIDDTGRKLTQAGYESCGTKIAPQGSIVLSKRAPIGHVALLARPACSSQGCFLLTPDEEHDSRYYYYWLSIQADRLQARGRGSTFMELSSDELKSIHIPVLPLSRQVAIADYLDRETAQIDGLIRAKEQLLSLLAEKHRAFVSRAVTRGLDSNAPLRDSGIPWLGKIPAHWETERARWLFRERDERSQTGREDLLTVSHLTGVTLRAEKEVNMFEAATTEGYKVCRIGDLVINTLWAWMGAMGVAPVDGIVSPAYNVYEPLGQIDRDYLDTIVRLSRFAQEVMRYSKGIWSSRLRLYPEGFFEARLPVPPLCEQRKIVRAIKIESRKLDDLARLARRTISLLKERRSALISAAVMGQIDIRGAA